jgi:hypothetical protein
MRCSSASSASHISSNRSIMEIRSAFQSMRVDCVLLRLTGTYRNRNGQSVQFLKLLNIESCSSKLRYNNTVEFACVLSISHFPQFAKRAPIAPFAHAAICPEICHKKLISPPPAKNSVCRCRTPHPPHYHDLRKRHLQDPPIAISRFTQQHPSSGNFRSINP